MIKLKVEEKGEASSADLHFQGSKIITEPGKTTRQG